MSVRLLLKELFAHKSMNNFYSNGIHIEINKLFDRFSKFEEYLGNKYLL